MFPDTKRCLLCNNIWRCLERCLEHTLWGNCWICLCYMAGTLETLENQTSIKPHLTPFLWGLRRFKPLTKTWIRQPKKSNKPSRVRKFPSQMGRFFPSTQVVPGSQGGWDGMDGDPQRSGMQGAGSKVGKGEGVGRWMQRVVRLDKKKQIGSFLGFG